MFNRRDFLLSAAAVPIAGRAGAKTGKHPDLTALYRVRDPLAGYFDVAERRRIMRDRPDLVLAQARLRAMRAPRCRKVRAIPVQDETITIPSFYGNGAAWRKAVTPFRDFEDAVSNLAAANLVAPERSHAECLVDLLVDWAGHDALAKFNHSSDYKQGWYQVESTLFAIGHALAAVRPDVLHRGDDLRLIDAWLLRVAKRHFSIPGASDGTCCNNHYYRRALYASVIGVLTGEDRLFADGVAAIHSALSGATAEGALPLEMARGELAAHYQNYALMYLVMIAEIAERQGYPVWDLEIDGKTLHTLVDFNNRIIADPNTVLKYSGVTKVSLKYRRDMQYFAWFEIFLARFANDGMEAWVAPHRPLYNRSLGGHLTAYFYVGA